MWKIARKVQKGREAILAVEGGFTLIELVIVIVIMGAALALAAPRIGKSLENVKLRAAARELSAVLRYTRQMAISKKSEYAVSIFEHGYVYETLARKLEDEPDQPTQIEGESTSSPRKDSELTEKGLKRRQVRVNLCSKLDNKEVSLSYQEPESDQEEQQEAEGEGLPAQDESKNKNEDKQSDLGSWVGDIIFYPKGESSGGTITLAVDNSKLAFQIEVDPITGRVKVQRAADHE